MSTTHEDLAPGQGIVTEQHVALSKDEHGKLHAVSSVCTHMGCDVEWNGDAREWDCPCHGSRFAPDGRVLRGPASRPLPPADAPK